MTTLRLHTFKTAAELGEILSQEVVDLVDAAALLEIHPQSLRRLVLQGLGPPGFAFAGKYLFLRSELVAWQQETGYTGKPGQRGAHTKHALRREIKAGQARQTPFKRKPVYLANAFEGFVRTGRMEGPSR